MNYLWQITIDDYLAVVKKAKANGKSPGDSMEEEFISYMKEKKQKPIGATELTKEEVAKEHASHGKNVLRIDTDKEGKQKYHIDKGEE